MHYTIFSCSPQSKSRSTSSLIADMIKQGLINDSEDTANIYYLNSKSSWNECQNIFYKSQVIIMVIPLYVEGVPGLLLEFLGTLDINKKKYGNLSFVIQGGFEEASQLWTAEQFLKNLPQYLNCNYGGTLIKGGLFGLSTMHSEKFRNKMHDQFTGIMKQYKKNNQFSEKISKEFAGEEYYSQGMILLTKITMPINKLAWFVVAKKMGAKKSLAYKPYS